jgi:hypothetical protein
MRFLAVRIAGNRDCGIRPLLHVANSQQQQQAAGKPDSTAVATGRAAVYSWTALSRLLSVTRGRRWARDGKNQRLMLEAALEHKNTWS